MIDVVEPNTQLTVTCETSSSYYRSRLYTSQIGKNPLLTAAQPIFSFLLRYQTSPEASLEIIEKNLSYELKAFTAYVRTFTYSEEVINLAQYALASLLYAKMQNIYWLKHTDCKLKPTCFGKKLPPVKLHRGYFQLITILCNTDEEVDYSDLLELCYQGLALDLISHRKPGEILENLYQAISHQRAPEVEPPKEKAIVAKTPKWRILGASAVVLTCVCVFAATYWGFYYVVDLSADQISQQVTTLKQQLTQLARESNPLFG